MNGFALLALVVLIVSPTRALSSSDAATPEALEARLQKIAIRLELSDAQRSRLEPILRMRFESTRDVLARHGLDPASAARPSRRDLLKVSAEMSALRDTTDAEVATILSEEQMATYRQIQSEQRAQIRAQAQPRLR